MFKNGLLDGFGREISSEIKNGIFEDLGAIGEEE